MRVLDTSEVSSAPVLPEEFFEPKKSFRSASTERLELDCETGSDSGTGSGPFCSKKVCFSPFWYLMTKIASVESVKVGP